MATYFALKEPTALADRDCHASLPLSLSADTLTDAAFILTRAGKKNDIRNSKVFQEWPLIIAVIMHGNH